VEVVAEEEDEETYIAVIGKLAFCPEDQRFNGVVYPVCIVVACSISQIQF
jgi:hypothetical protein